MFKPRLADLLEPVVVVGATAQSIKILRDNGMVGIRQRKPVQRLIAVIARGRSNAETDSMIHGIVSVLRHFWELADDDIRPGHQCWGIFSGDIMQRWHHD